MALDRPYAWIVTPGISEPHTFILVDLGGPKELTDSVIFVDFTWDGGSMQLASDAPDPEVRFFPDQSEEGGLRGIITVQMTAAREEAIPIGKSRTFEIWRRFDGVPYPEFEGRLYLKGEGSTDGL